MDTNTLSNLLISEVESTLQHHLPALDLNIPEVNQVMGKLEMLVWWYNSSPQEDL